MNAEMIRNDTFKISWWKCIILIALHNGQRSQPKTLFETDERSGSVSRVCFFASSSLTFSQKGEKNIEILLCELIFFPLDKTKCCFNKLDIWRYSTVLQYPRATIWKHSDQIIFFLNVFSDGHEAATKDGDHKPFVREHPFCFFEQIPPKYKYTGNYCWQPKYRQIPIWFANIKYRILLNTAKHYMGTVAFTLFKCTNALCLTCTNKWQLYFNVRTPKISSMFSSENFANLSLFNYLLIYPFTYKLVCHILIINDRHIWL